MHARIQTLLTCIELEEKEQVYRYRLDQQHTLKQLKAEGLALHPLIVTRKNFGYADYPEISFRINFPPEENMFKDGSSIECFISGQEPIKGVLLSLEGRTGEFRLYAPDFPDWIEEDGMGIKLAPDTRTTGIMKSVLADLEKNKKIYPLFEKIHQPENSLSQTVKGNLSNLSFTDPLLDPSQQQAIKAILQNREISIVHGPPGTGKTTTLIEAVIQLIKTGEKILVSAPSNTAVDNIAKGLVRKGVKLLRVGNMSKVDEELFPNTPEGKLMNSREQKEIKQLKIKAEEFRRMALKYKRSFGKAEREQRNLLFREVRDIRHEIKKLQSYLEERLFAEADVIASTPVGLYDADLARQQFHSLIIDEAGQCIEPLAWSIIPMAEKVVLAGDHLQLPPTVLSLEAARLGFSQSILETAIQTIQDVHLLDTQYRMTPSIAGFSSHYFYGGALKTSDRLADMKSSVIFIDTAGSGYQEKTGPDGTSLLNEGELHIAKQVIETGFPDPASIAFISPYSGQVIAAREYLPEKIRISTIDSFQGQENEVIILSLVRSNDENEIGFLKDYRRMNVAITRAKKQLVVIGDSATIGADPFYNAFLIYVEKNGDYKTVWEFEM